MKLKSIIFTFVCMIMAGLVPANAQPALSAAQVAQKAAAVVNDAKGLQATFTIQGNGRTGNGSIKSSGTKFNVSLPDIEIWYNGKDLYTYNARTSETTVVNPTARELLESNPLLYVKGGGSGYTYSFSPVKKNGKYVVDMTPTNNKSEIKKMTFTVNSTTFATEKINVTTKSGNLVIDIKSFKTSVPISASDFEYPKSKFPKAEIVDLR